jgi:hypothetical protein
MIKLPIDKFETMMLMAEMQRLSLGNLMNDFAISLVFHGTLFSSEGCFSFHDECGALTHFLLSSC